MKARGSPFGGRVLRVAQQFFDVFGFRLVDERPPFPDITDAEFYKPMFLPWLMPEWKERLRADDPHSLLPIQSRYVLYSLALDAARRCNGEFAECGVYKGGTAKILAEIVQDRPLHLFDTFSGMPEADPVRDLHKAGDFADTNVQTVRQYLAGHKNVNCMRGMIPESLELVRDSRFAFVHVDLDIYLSIMSACNFFYPRLQAGGILLFDDYGYSSCPGARTAVDEFFSDKPEVPLVLTTGQCSVRKL